MIEWLKNLLFPVEPEAPVPPAVLSVADFGLLMRCRNKAFRLYEYERSEEASVIWLDPVALFVDHVEERIKTGRLINPPRIYVVHLSEELGELKLLRTDAEVLKELKPEYADLIFQTLRQLRVANKPNKVWSSASVLT
jgi:hypothetical protein